MGGSRSRSNRPGCAAAWRELAGHQPGAGRKQRSAHVAPLVDVAAALHVDSQHLQHHLHAVQPAPVLRGRAVRAWHASAQGRARRRPQAGGGSAGHGGASPSRLQGNALRRTGLPTHSRAVRGRCCPRPPVAAPNGGRARSASVATRASEMHGHPHPCCRAPIPDPESRTCSTSVSTRANEMSPTAATATANTW